MTPERSEDGLSRLRIQLVRYEYPSPSPANDLSTPVRTVYRVLQKFRSFTHSPAISFQDSIDGNVETVEFRTWMTLARFVLCLLTVNARQTLAVTRVRFWSAPPLLTLPN